MTDAEIIKDWEKILSTGDAPIGEHWFVTTKLAKETFDMLKSQKAEIERLTKKVDYLKDANKRNDAHLHVRLVGQAKSEARKEFAEKVKPIIDEILDIMFDDAESKCIVENCKKPSSIPCESELCIGENKELWKMKIDNLLEEMEGNDG